MKSAAIYPPEGEIRVYRRGSGGQEWEVLTRGLPPENCSVNVLRDHGGRPRRPFVRFYACQEDLSHGSWSDPLPGPVVRGEEPLLVVGAMAGG